MRAIQQSDSAYGFTEPYVPPPAFNNIIPFGDSLTADSYPSDPGRVGLPIARNTPREWNNYGVPNETLQDMLNRQSTVITAALGYGAQAVRMRAGTNGAGGGDFATKYAQLVDAFIAAGLFVFCHAVPPKSGSNLSSLNTSIQAICAARTTMTKWVDDASVIATTGYQPISGRTSDGIHMNSVGQYEMGVVQGGILAPYFTTDPLVLDSTAAAAQWVNNPLNSGTGGTKSGGTGTVPDSVSVSAFGSGTSFVASIVASSDSNPNPWLDIELTASGGNGHSIEVRYSMTHPAIDADYLTHRAIDSIAEVQLVNLDTTNVSGLNLGCDSARTYIAPTPRMSLAGNGTVNQQVVMRNCRERNGPSAYSANTLKVMLNIAFTGAFVNAGHIRIRCVSGLGVLP